MSSKQRLLAVTLLMAGGFAATAQAGTQTTNFNVTATVINDCVISSSNIAFGSYDPTTSTALTAQGAITAKCTKGDVVTVALSQGANSAIASTAAVPVRQMASGTNMLPYHIYLASTGTTEWGTGASNQPVAQTSLSVNTPLSFVTYGSLPAGTDVPAGSYSDTVTATVSY
jgi:spore coat protein U-like protein